MESICSTFTRGRKACSPARPGCPRKRARKRRPWSASRKPNSGSASVYGSAKLWKPGLRLCAKSLKSRRRRQSGWKRSRGRGQGSGKTIAKRWPVAVERIPAPEEKHLKSIEEFDEKVSENQGVRAPQLATNWRAGN